MMLLIAAQLGWVLPGAGGWRCTTSMPQPIELGVAMRGP
jgi:hypothetical protein